MGHKEVREIDLVTLWVVEVTLTVVKTWVEEEALVMDVVVAEVIMGQVRMDTMDLEVASMAVVLAVVAEEAMMVMDQDMDPNTADIMVVEEDMKLAMKEEILAAVTVVMVGTF
jgi:hypothetical protein